MLAKRLKDGRYRFTIKFKKIRGKYPVGKVEFQHARVYKNAKVKKGKASTVIRVTSQYRKIIISVQAEFRPKQVRIKKGAFKGALVNKDRLSRYTEMRKEFTVIPSPYDDESLVTYDEGLGQRIAENAKKFVGWNDMACGELVNAALHDSGFGGSYGYSGVRRCDGKSGHYPDGRGIPDVSYQWRSFRIPKSAAKPGDIIEYQHDHISVYIGGGKAVHGGFGDCKTVEIANAWYKPIAMVYRVANYEYPIQTGK
jgi:hypothetical protein